MLIKDSARLAAEETLKDHWNGSFPVDPVAIAKSQGVSVTFATLKDSLTGAIVAKEDQHPRILVESSENFGRQMFTIAHALGHYTERHGTGAREYTFVEGRHRVYPLHEFYADEYAAHLLMPESAFQRMRSLSDSDFVLAAYFGVSPSAVRNRTARLGVPR